LPIAAAIGVWSGSSIESHTHRSRATNAVVSGLTIAPGADGRLMIGWSSRAASNAN
jgi:hypothetical protein